MAQHVSRDVFFTGRLFFFFFFGRLFWKFVHIL